MALETASKKGGAQAGGNQGQELETAKEILVEVFHARPGEVEEMIQRRLEESGPERAQGRAVASDVLPGGVDMGRRFEGKRMGAKGVSARWLKASRALKKED